MDERDERKRTSDQASKYVRRHDRGAAGAVAASSVTALSCGDDPPDALENPYYGVSTGEVHILSPSPAKTFVGTAALVFM